MTQFVPLDYSFFTLYAVGMEPHPIPQNVTTFQFHLVGDMTLRQFLYLAAGAVIAYILFVFLTPVYPLVAWSGVAISALSGTAFAFLPINSRPLDYWLGAFLKAIYSPTKRVWQKGNKNYKNDPLFNSRLVTYLSSLQFRNTQNNSDSQNIRRPESQINRNSDTLISSGTLIPSESFRSGSFQTPLPTTAQLGKAVNLARQAQNLQIRILQSERALNQIKAAAQRPYPVPPDYSNQVNKIIADLQILVTQASQVRAQLDTVTKGGQTKAAPVIPAAQVKTKIKVVAPAIPKQTQVALTTFPNVINGIITDNGGNYIEGCVAVIYDKEGLPVRALKTNKLGQFTGSTPLPNGTYKLSLEKENFIFDDLQLELGGEVLPPLVIKAK